MIEALDLTRLPRVLFGASGVDVVGTTKRVRKVPQPITASDVGIGTRRRLPRNPVRAGQVRPSRRRYARLKVDVRECGLGFSSRATASSPNTGRNNRIKLRIVR